jgi:outer membrane lipoprotein-sorting protein
MAATLMPAAQAAPALPSRTPAQLLASVAAQSQVPAFTGTVLETTSLGLPQLPGTQSPTSMLSLLTGSHTIHVWYASPRQYRLALPGSMSETDLYRNGSTGWLWQSVPDTVTTFTLPAHPATKAEAQPPMTPQQAANAVLSAVGPTTTVSVDSNVFVAGQPAYELALAPKDARSLVGQVRIAIDAKNNVPLRVQVFARHATSPAISVGFTSVTFAAPSASDLTFTPPRGAKITTVNPPADHGSGSASPNGVSTTGSGWLTVLKLPSSLLTEATTAGGKQAASNAPISVNGGPGDSAAAVQALLGAATAVHGTWGSGQLLRTSLVSVLITNGTGLNGTVYVGAVQPSVLYAAAAHH